jgi:hypothetical protein
MTFAPCLMFVGKTRSLRLSRAPFMHTLDKAGKACVVQTLQLIPKLITYDCKKFYNIFKGYE